MLESTFIHVQGIGPATESSLWRQGALTWHDYLREPERIMVAPRHRARLQETLLESIEALESARVDYFARCLPTREHWRAASAFPKLGYLDIETDGGMNPDSVTIIGLFDGYETTIYTKGRDLARFACECQEFDGFVTFFGGGFDVPMLKRRFPVLENVFADRLHIDLCPLLKTLGYRGGLKSIERQMGIRRRPETDGLSGYDAVRLWRRWQEQGEECADALRLLHMYNEEDVVNLEALFKITRPNLYAALRAEPSVEAHLCAAGSDVSDS
jgi:uncharacterized protein YprB with RNaseH-like and TPR domain